MTHSPRLDVGLKLCREGLIPLLFVGGTRTKKGEDQNGGLVESPGSCHGIVESVV